MASLRSRFRGPDAEERFIKARDAQRARSLAAIRAKRAMDPATLRRLEVYQELAAIAGEKCAICGTGPSEKRRLSIDHCHASDEIRGLLCGPCNLLLGNAKDSVDILRAAIDYLSRDAYTGRNFAEALSVSDDTP